MHNLKRGVVIPFLNSNDNDVMEVNIDSIQDANADIKEKNNFEEALTKNDEIFINMSHELKTPLNVIFSSTQLMEISLTDNSTEINKGKILKSIGSIKQNCYRLTRLINNIIDISKILNGNLNLNVSNENIVEVIENIVQAASGFIKEKKLNVIFDSNVEEKIIVCDREKIERVVLNLISNAIKFSNPDGSIFINVLDKGDNVEISVKDNGIGIENEYLENIFDRFSQVDKSLSRIAEGSGIGLHFVKLIVEMHGGKIFVQSKAGEGSILIIELPTKTCNKLNEADKIVRYDNENEMIKIEFSDIV